REVMATVLTTGQDHETAWDYLTQVRKHYTQSQIARELKIDVRTVRRWEARQTPIKPYLAHALQRMLPFEPSMPNSESFAFIDLFAGIGGIRKAFERIGGHCVFTSEWDSYAQKTYAYNFPN